MLSTTADHAVRALLVLARGEPGRPMRADEIAAATGAPQNYMAKTLNMLAKAGFVMSTRGPAGGFALVVPADRITLDDVISVFDTRRPQSRCMLGARPCDPRHPCAAHELWTALMHARRRPLLDTTIATLTGIPTAALHP